MEEATVGPGTTIGELLTGDTQISVVDRYPQGGVGTSKCFRNELFIYIKKKIETMWF